MPQLHRHALLCCIALLNLLGGCERSSQSKKQENDHSQPATATSQTSVALRDSRSSNEPPSEISQRARSEDLTTRVTQAQARHDSLTQEKARMAAQLASHQADSAATLDKFKTEFQELQRREALAGARNNAQPDAFSERARNQLEHALAMDQEYQLQIAQADEELRELDTSMAAMRAEIETLGTSK